jgi:hypothetical protein
MTKNDVSDTGTLELERPFPSELGRIALSINMLVPVEQVDTRTHQKHISDIWDVRLPQARWATSAPKATFAELLASISFLSQSATTVAAAALFNWLSLFGRGNSTVPINLPMLLHVEQVLRRPSILVSPRLRMSRAAVGVSALLAPSGTLLTWSEVIAEEQNGRD